jgi:uncharacterized SAM-binding protein YcdF (DUF218 family)
MSVGPQPQSIGGESGRGATPWVRRLRVLSAVGLVCVLAVVGGFIWFLLQLRSSEERPTTRADGIVVLTGGSSRVADAIDLLANGYGSRLLISGVHWANGSEDISRRLPESQPLLACCVDLDHSAINTRSNATETERWARERGFHSLIVVTSNYHMPRAIVELAHAMPDVTLIPYAVIGEKWRDEPWWSSGAAARLLLSEYAKYLVAGVRVHVNDWLVRIDRNASEAVGSHKPIATAAN